MIETLSIKNIILRLNERSICLNIKSLSMLVGVEDLLKNIA